MLSTNGWTSYTHPDPIPDPRWHPRPIASSHPMPSHAARGNAAMDSADRDKRPRPPELLWVLPQRDLPHRGAQTFSCPYTVFPSSCARGRPLPAYRPAQVSLSERPAVGSPSLGAFSSASIDWSPASTDRRGWNLNRHPPKLMLPRPALACSTLPCQDGRGVRSLPSYVPRSHRSHARAPAGAGTVRRCVRGLHRVRSPSPSSHFFSYFFSFPPVSAQPVDPLSAWMGQAASDLAGRTSGRR